MSRYVDKKHGVIIGSDNVFFYRDEDGEFHDFNAVLWLKNFAFDPHTTNNCFIRTPAFQLLWQESKIEIPETFGDVSFKREIRVFQPSNAAHRWCDQNAPGWGHRPLTRDYDPTPTFFFKRRKDALAMSKWIDETLKGCPNYA
jgi:hypothetical protein